MLADNLDAAADDDLAAVPPPGGLRVGSVCRLVKKSTSRAFNRAASAASDADFFARFLEGGGKSSNLDKNFDGGGNLDLGDLDLGDLDLGDLSSLPVFANARAGLWHVDLRHPRVQMCRFKSTDGHAAMAAAAAGRGRGGGGGGGGPSFPLSRLNLGVAAAAAAAGGSGSGFPKRRGVIIVDSTRKGKRFPDALSRTIPTWAAVINRACRIWIREEEEDGEEKGEKEKEKEKEETGDVSLLMPPWVPASERSQVGAKVEAWARLLLSTGVDFSGFAKELSLRPLVPVWVSRKGGGEKETGRGSASVEVVRAEGGDDKNGTAATPLYLFSASDPGARRASVSCGCHCNSSSAEKEKSQHPPHGCFDWSFDYEPGGGDDEEGWSRGLSARTFWEHRGELLSRGPGEFEEAVGELVGREEKEEREKRRGGGEGEEGGSGEARAKAKASSPPSWSFVCGTRLAIGNAAAAASLAASSSSASSLCGSERGGAAAAPAVVSFGSNDDDEEETSSSSPSPLFFRAPVSPRKKLGLLEALPSVVAFASAHLSQGITVLFTSGDGDDNEEEEKDFESAATAAAAVLLACFSPPPRAAFLGAFDDGRASSSPALSSRPCGCPAPPRASREEVRARIAAVCGSATANSGSRTSEEERGNAPPPSPSLPLPLSVGKEAAKQLLMFVSPPESPGGFHCPACRAGRPAWVGWERAGGGKGKGKEEGEEEEAAVEVEA